MSETPENQQQYGSILTILGENAEQNGKLQNKQITFTHIAIGDANDTYIQPDRKQNALTNELARIPINSVDVLQPTPESVPMLKVEAVLPDDVNDLVIREFAAVATFNGEEYFHAVGNCARIYVPAPVNNGNVSTPVTLEMIFVITSAEPIVEIDPNVITASREFVSNSISSGTYLVSKTVSDMIQGLSTGLGVVVPMHGQNWSTQAYLIVDDEKSKLGGGEYIYDANKPKSHHDGGIVISPTVPFDGTLGKLPNFLSGVGETDPEGVGCFVRKLTDYEMPEMWGAQGDGESDDIYPISSADKSSPSRHIKYRPVVYAMGNHPDHPQGFSPSRDRTTHEGVGFSWTGESGHTIFKYIGQINDVFALLKLSRANIGYDTNSSRNYHVKNIKLDCNGRCGFGLYENYAGDDSVAENIVIINSRYRAGHVVKSWYNSIQNIVAYKNYGSGLSFGIPLDDLIPDTTEVLDVNGFDITKPRAHSNGRQLPNETTLEWEARRFNEMENRVATWGLGIGFVHGYNQSNPVSEHNYGPGIYRTNAGGSDTRGLVSTGGYVERNCEAARADGVSTKNWEVWHDGDNSSTRGEKFTGLWFNPDLSGESGAVKIAGTPKTTNKNQLVKFEKCPNISIPDPEHEQYTNDSDSGGGSMPNPFVAQYQTMGVSSSAFTLRDPRDGSSNQFALFRYNASSAYENSKAVEVLPRGNDQVALRISMNATTGGTDGQSDLGNPSMRWKGGYFVDSPAGTSDETQKTDFKAIPAGYVDTLCDIADELGIWRWIAAIAEKGDKARYHVGPTAQEVYRKFQAIGIDAFKYGFVGKDPLTKMVKVGEQKNEDGTYSPVYESKPVVDDEGNQKEIWNIRHIELLYAMQWASMKKMTNALN